MRALNIFRLLSLAIFLHHGEATDAVNQEGKEMTEGQRKLQFDWRYWDQYNYLAHTGEPTPQPTFKPTPYPTPRPTPLPTGKPTYSPTHYPSPRPTPRPTHKPSPRPTRRPTGPPVPRPTRKPTPNPTPDPTPGPTIRPTPSPTRMPTMEPSRSPTPRPTPSPTAFPTPSPTPRPTPLPTTAPPTEMPTPRPTENESPSEFPTETQEPSEEPTLTSEPSENPTSTTSFSGSSTLSFNGGCVGTETILDIICAPFNSNVLGDLCNEVNERGLNELLDDCNRRLTLFAPNNAAFSTFFDYFNDAFFSDPTNFPLEPIGDIILDPNARRLDEADEDFEQSLMSDILGYHLLNGVFRVQNLECDGSVNMLQRGATTTKCENGARVRQVGTCNGLQPNFAQTDIVAANGIIHVLTQVLIPSPDNTVAGCADIGDSTSPTKRAIIIASP